MSDAVVRKLLVTVGFKVDDGELDQTDKRTRQTTKSADAMEAAFKKAAAALAALGIASKAMESIKANLDFEKQLGKLQTLVPDNIAQVQSYRKELIDMSQRTGKGLGELADATYEVGSAFGVTADTIAITEMAAKAATAAGAETKDAVNLMSAVTLAYGDSTAAANAKVGDLASLAANLGKTSLPEMAAGMGQVTGAAVQLGVKQEELFAIIGTAAGVTGPTAQMLTQLKATMTGLSAPTKDLQKVYKKLGITAIEQEVAQKGLVPTLERIMKATDGSVKSSAKLFSSDEARAFILPMVTKLSGRYADTVKAMGKAEGSATKAYDSSTKGLASNAHAAELAEAKMAALKVMVGEKLTPTYLEFLDLMLKVSGTFANAEKDSDRLTGTLQGHLKTLGEFKETVGAIIKFLMSPIIAIGKLLDHMLLALKAVTDFVKDPSLANAGEIGKQIGLTAVHGFSTAALGTPEMLNQMFGGANSGIATALGFDSRGLLDPRMALMATPANVGAAASMYSDGMGGMRGALFADINNIRASAANRGLAEVGAKVTNDFSATIASLQVIVGAGTPEQIAEQTAKVAAQRVVNEIFRGMRDTLRMPEPQRGTP